MIFHSIQEPKLKKSRSAQDIWIPIPWTLISTTLDPCVDGGYPRVNFSHMFGCDKPLHIDIHSDGINLTDFNEPFMSQAAPHATTPFNTLQQH